ncbi:MAG: hypothetical protein HY924_15265 [Elusimicrobia bacterium]|nr:hypothetical protein [Elusimicrobiota bacterium]
MRPGRPSSLTITSGPITVEARLHPVPARPGKGLDPARARRRYQGFLTSNQPQVVAELTPFRGETGAEDAAVTGSGPFACSAERFSWELDGPRCRGRLNANPADLDSLLRTLFAHLAVRSNGVILHAASLSFGGRAHLFVGVSGAGKTTLSRCLGGRTFGGQKVATLSDELVLLTNEGTAASPRFRVHSTPFWGEFRMPANNGSAPLGRIFLLAKGKAKVAPLAAAQAQARLLRCLVCFERSKTVLSSSWDLLLAALARHPAAELSWDGKDAEHIVEIMRQERTTP